MRRKLRQNIFLITILLVFCIITSYSITTLSYTKENLESKNNQLLSTKAEINDYNKSLENTIKNINHLINQNKTKLKDPTYKETLDFIFNDSTNENIYHDTDYNCVHFSTDVNNNAEENGIRCAYVELTFNYNYPHAIVAFNTIDKGLVFFEPQLDEIAHVEIGKDYWGECVENSTSKGAGNIVINYKLYW